MSLQSFSSAAIKCSLPFVLCSAALAQVVVLASVDSNAVQGNGESTLSTISSDGRYIAFVSGADNLVAADTNAELDVFLRDRVAGTTTLVSLAWNGAQANGGVGLNQPDRPALSPDGRFVAFASLASNLVPNDTNARTDVFLRDVLSGTTERISVSSAGVQALSHSALPDISADARYVLFASRAGNLVPGDTNGAGGWDIFLRDRLAGTTTRLNVDSSGVEANGLTYWPSMSPDARFVVYASTADNLVTGDVNSANDVFLLDRQTGVTEIVSVHANGLQANGHSGLNMQSPYGSFGNCVSADGRYVAFVSWATNLVASDTNALTDVFVRDRVLGVTSRVSVSSLGLQSIGASAWASLSDDGRWVVYWNSANNLVPGSTPFGGDAYVHDRVLGTTELICVDANGVQGNASALYSSISADGRFVAFDSLASTLVPADTNVQRDVFVRERCGTVKSYCTPGLTTNGCAATLSSTGTPSASAGSGFTITASSVEGQKTGLFFYGIDGPNAVSWGATSSSFLCVRYPVQRTATQNSGGTASACDGSIALDWNAYVAAHPAALGSPFPFGQRVNAQLWFRDPPAPKTTNLSDGIEFTVCP